jgi:hypothetical protein
VLTIAEFSEQKSSSGETKAAGTSFFHNSLEHEYIDGIKIVRQVGKYGLYRSADKYYKKNNSHFDLIVDEINVRPFLTPKFVEREPILALIHQVSPEQFLPELPFPLSHIGRYYLEKNGNHTTYTYPL